jgi:hypothetical protein
MVSLLTQTLQIVALRAAYVFGLADKKRDEAVSQCILQACRKCNSFSNHNVKIVQEVCISVDIVALTQSTAMGHITQTAYHDRICYVYLFLFLPRSVSRIVTNSVN